MCLKIVGSFLKKIIFIHINALRAAAGHFAVFCVFSGVLSPVSGYLKRKEGKGINGLKCQKM